MNWNKILGSLIVLGNLYWVWINLRLFYMYNFTEILFALKIPNWALFLYVIFGLIGIYIGVKVFKATWSIKKGLSVDLPIIIIGILIEMFR